MMTKKAIRIPLRSYFKLRFVVPIVDLAHTRNDRKTLTDEKGDVPLPLFFFHDFNT